ncbi:MAG: CvpA family protein [Candidatus Levybacteria bacterium]|nr:CvpA family protein [Candidatus Levybacteria bacterium]
MDINSVVSSVSIVSLGLNWIDIILIIIVTIYAVEGYFLGFFTALVDFVSFILSFVFGLSFYSVLANILVKYFNIPQGFSNAIGFLVIAIAFEIVFSVLFRRLVFTLPLFIKTDSTKHKVLWIENFLGIIPGFLSGIVLASFILSLIIALPFSVFLKHSVTDSRLGSVLVSNTQVFAKNLNAVFGGAVNDTLSFLTVEPQTDKSIDLKFKTKNVSVDKTSEQLMFKMVNEERQSRGLKALVFSESLAVVGRNHCKDMFIKGYFSHYTPEGLSPFDRMVEGDIAFNYAGENLALAPNADLAMKGFMQSPGHKANILSVNFGKVGIGTIDGGIYGEMFCQEYTD